MQEEKSSRFSKIHKILFIILSIMILIFISLFAMFLTGKESRQTDAMTVHQHIRINALNSKVEGDLWIEKKKVATEKALKTPKRHRELKARLEAEKIAHITATSNPEKVNKNTTNNITKKSNITIIDNHKNNNHKNNNFALAPAPNFSLIEKTPIGKLPKISDKNVKPWQYYGRNYKKKSKLPEISFIITGLGLNEKITNMAIAMDENISLSFSPYASKLQQWISVARSKGHEVWLDAPMELADYPASDGGELTLLKNATAEENATITNKLLAKSTGYIGLIPPQDEVFSAHIMMNNFAKTIRSRGLLLAFRTKEYYSSNAIYMNRHLSRNMDISEILRTLAELKIIAKNNDIAIVAADASPNILYYISQFVNESVDIEIIPSSAAKEEE